MSLVYCRKSGCNHKVKTGAESCYTQRVVGEEGQGRGQYHGETSVVISAGSLLPPREETLSGSCRCVVERGRS